MMKQIVLLFFSAFLFSSCSKPLYIEDMVYYDRFTKGLLWIGEKNIDYKKTKQLAQQDGYPLVLLDQNTSQLWSVLLIRKDRAGFFYNIIDGEVTGEPLFFDFSGEPVVGFHTDNKALFSLNDDLGVTFISYELIDLLTLEQQVIKIPKNIFDKSWYLWGAIGFVDTKIYFRDGGYYDFEEKKAYKYEEPLLYPRFLSRERKIIGLTSESLIAIYDIDTGKTTITPVKREIPRYAKYSGNDFYYLEGDNLYYSKDIPNILDRFFLIWYTNRKWFCYNMIEKKTYPLYSPDRKSILLGRVKSLK